MNVSSYVTAGVVAAFVALVGTSALSGSPAAKSARAQAAAMDNAAVEKALTANEQKVNDSFAKRDIATFKSMVAADGIAVDMGGITMGMAGIEQMIAGSTVTESQLSDMTVWVNSGGKWMAHFHQETAAMAMVKETF